MKVLVVGGGSGGHVTPAVAVVREILREKPRTRVEFWTDRKYYRNVEKITTEIGVNTGAEKRLSGRRKYVRVRKIMAGKFRRYAGWSFLDYFRNWDITLKDLVGKNILGFFGFVGGMIQSFARLFLKRGRPDVIFLKGGYVGLPVGMMAQLFKIPYVIHESDATAGLANRLLMRNAMVVAMGVPFNEEKAPKNWRFVGTPVAQEFKKITPAKQRSLKKTFGFDPDKTLVVVTGGSQGSLHMNEVMREILPEMLKFTSVGLIAGRTHFEEMIDLKKYEVWDKAKLMSNFRMWAFNTTMNELMGAADVVISRAGATTIAELAALEKATILVPFEKLPGGHQVKNAEKLAGMEAAAVITDARMVRKPDELLEVTRRLVRSPKQREKLGENLHSMARPEAAADLAAIILKVGKARQRIELNEDIRELKEKYR